MKNKIFLILIIVVFFSCKNKVRYVYYDTGELKLKIEIIDNDSSYCNEYYINGNIKSEGGFKAGEDTFAKDTFATGFWRYYYSDGELKWQGYCDKGIKRLFGNNKVPDYDTINAYIKVWNNQKFINVNEPFIFRIYIDELYPSYYYVTAGFFKSTKTFFGFDANYNPAIIREEDYPYGFVINEETLKLCEEGKLILNRNCDCDSLEIIVHLPALLSGQIILRDEQPKKYFKFPIKRK